MISLEKSEKFQNEYNGYIKRINLVETIRVKAELQGLLEKLIVEVRNIDRQHQQLVDRNTLPDSVSDSKNKVIEIRKKILKLLDDYEKAKN